MAGRKRKRLLVACEFSGKVRDAFLEVGWDAWSCDLRRCILPNKNSERHLRQDVRPLLREPWDLVIAHPPCTYLCNSGVRWLDGDNDRFERMLDACLFFTDCLEANAPMVCVENPIMHGLARVGVKESYTQIVHPWQFGHGETKATCLWLEGLPKLEPTRIVEGRKPRVHFLSGRWRKSERSITYTGVAKAMAQQWG